MNVRDTVMWLVVGFLLAWAVLNAAHYKQPTSCVNLNIFSPTQYFRLVKYEVC
jgi:hypothetical protein